MKLRFWLSVFVIVAPAVASAVAPDLSSWQRNISGDSTNELTYSEDPEILVSGNTVHVLSTAWVKTNYNARRLYYSRSVDGGASFQTPLMLVESSGLDTGIGRFRRLAVDGNSVHIVSTRSPKEGGDWYYVLDYYRSTDNGASFEARQLRSGEVAWHMRMPHIVAGGGKVYIASLYYPNWYTDSHITVMKSDDGGSTFASLPVMETSTESYDLWDFQRDGDKLALAVVASKGIPGSYGSTFRLLVAASTDAGADWQINQVCSTNAEGWPQTDGLADYATKPDLAWAGSHLYVTWTGQDIDGSRAAFVARSIDSGATFEPQVNLSGGQTGTPQPGQATLAARGNCAYVVWNVPNSGIWMRRSLDGGATWQNARLLFGGWWPLVTVDPESADGTKVHFLASPGLYRSSDDGGATLVGTVYLATEWNWWGSGVKNFQWCVGPGSVVYLAFPGYQSLVRDDDYDLYFRRYDPQASPLKPENECLVLSGDNSQAHYENMQIPVAPALHLSTELTVEMWVRADENSPRNSDLLFQPNSDDYRGTLRLQTHDWAAGRRPSGKILTTNGLAEVWGGELLGDGEWHHFAMTYDAAAGNNNLLLYVDGHFSAAATAKGPLQSSDHPMYVGGAPSSVYQTFSGAVDEIRIWNRALTEQEIRLRTTARLAPNEPGLVAYYPLDGSTKEFTGRGKDGVLMFKEYFAPAPAVPLPVLTSAPSSGAAAGQPFAFQLLADWATGFGIEGNVPPGLSLEPLTGRLSGTPSTPGVYDFLVRATNRASAASQAFHLVVSESSHTLFRDDFTGGFATGWNPLPEDTSYYRLTNGCQLWVRANDGDTWQHYNRDLNLFTIDAPSTGDWVATLGVSRYQPTARDYNSLHLVAWRDTDNYVRLNYGSSGGNRAVALTSENAQLMDSYGCTTNFGPTPFQLRLTKSGESYSGSFSFNGVDFFPVATNTVTLKTPSGKIGFWMGIDPGQENTAEIDFFEVTTGTSTNLVTRPHLEVGLRPDTGMFSLSWLGAAGRSYQLQWASDPMAASWNNLGAPKPGTGEPLQFEEAVSAATQRFYRVLLLP